MDADLNLSIDTLFRAWTTDMGADTTRRISLNDHRKSMDSKIGISLAVRESFDEGKWEVSINWSAKGDTNVAKTREFMNEMSAILGFADLIRNKLARAGILAEGQ